MTSDVLYYVQVINPAGGEYGAERTPVPVNRRMAVTRLGPEQWVYDGGLWAAIMAAPRNSTGEYRGLTWIKE